MPYRILVLSDGEIQIIDPEEWKPHTFFESEFLTGAHYATHEEAHKDVQSILAWLARLITGGLLVPADCQEKVAAFLDERLT